MADADTALAASPATNSRPLPAQVDLPISEVQSPRFTPRELTAIKAHFGRAFAEIIADDTDDKFVVFAWLKLRRDGYPVDLDAMQDIVIRLVADVTLDPTTGQPVATSPPSVATGA